MARAHTARLGLLALVALAVVSPPLASARAQRVESIVIAARTPLADAESRSPSAGIRLDGRNGEGNSPRVAPTALEGDAASKCDGDGTVALDTSATMMAPWSALPVCYEARRDTVAPKSSWLAPLRRMPVWATPIASVLLPGLGQFRLHQDRFVAYMAVEAFAVLQYAKDRREGRDNAAAYRGIARDVARRGFVTAPPDTIWQYYEKLEKFIESGAYTLSPNGPTVPETDPATYNGFLWQQARLVYGVPLDDPGAVGSPRYQLALARYEETAVRQPYRWSWRNAQLEQDLFRRSITRSNDAYRRATTDLGVLIANHLLSSVDAFATVRLLQAGPGSFRFSAAIPVK